MNGIIHSSCQAKLNAAKTDFSEENVFGAILSYISYIVKRIKPEKLLFIAIDGVSPRAKLNQQRARRFSHVPIPIKNSRSKSFDVNCITPGTEFMSKLSCRLEDFVQRQVSKDVNWQKIQVILSTHEVPGEGEHKILEYLRNTRLLSDYNPNLRHCLYGSDSDLVVLGLLSHELNFIVMREKLASKRNGSKARSQPLNPQNFTLIRLSTLRKYFDQEFASLQELVHFHYDLEKLIDDFILLTSFVGNDFLPSLPYMNMVKDPLDFVLSTYKYLVQTSELDGYINEQGAIDLGRLKIFISRLSAYEDEIFQCRYADVGCSQQERSESAQISVCKQSINTDNYLQWKSQYYTSKLRIEPGDKLSISRIVQCYIEGIQWLLHYYYHGVASWSWFFPYHYAPMVSDLREFTPFTMKFDLGTPFRPLEHLMSVLPVNSNKLLPSGYRDLMLDPVSPIIDFYPKKYPIDTERSNATWEAVVQIPFIEENRLIKTLESRWQSLTSAEQERNNVTSVKSFGRFS